MKNQKKYNTFRLTFPEFVYESYHYDVQPDGLHIGFLFKLNDQLQFRPSAFIPNRPFLRFDQPREWLDLLVFNIGMIELVSYWKSVCSPVVRVKCGALDDEQIGFWKKLYYNGLGEFFYTNGISATQDNFMQIVCDGTRLSVSENELPLHLDNTYLVPVGGGKDSVVTLEALPQGRPLIMNPRGATVACAEMAGYPIEQVLVIKRTIDPLLLDLNAKGCLNGHTPFSAMLAFHSLLAMLLSGTRNVALSNENSANESTVLGSTVNHQYSKSYEFEQDFRAYVSAYISPAFNYFSFLRPLSELQIAMLFSGYERYFPVFRSCNVGSKQDIWCGHCAKCLFAYIILSPFISPQQLDAVFGKPMLDDTSLQREFDELTGRLDVKPFECVGTVDEVNTALSMTCSRWYAQGVLPALLRQYNPVEPIVSLVELNTENNLSVSEMELLKNALTTRLGQVCGNNSFSFCDISKQ